MIAPGFPPIHLFQVESSCFMGRGLPVQTDLTSQPRRIRGEGAAWRARPGKVGSLPMSEIG